MNRHRLGFWLAVIFLLIDLGQAHQMIPFAKYLRLGAVSQLALLALVLPDLANRAWLTRIAFWRLLFIAAVAAGLLFGVNLGKVRDVLQVEFFRFFANFLALSFFARDLSDLRKINAILILLALALSLWVLTHGGHGPGTLVDENDVGLVLVMLLPFSYLQIFEGRDKRVSAFCLGVFLLTLAAIAATLSRGAMVGALPTLFFLWLRSKRKVAGLVVVAVLLVVAVFSAPEQLIREFKTISDTKEATAASRTYFWGLSVDLFLARPVFGVGANSWGLAIWSNIITVPGAVSNMTPHSVYFQLISELGLAGTIAWFGMLAAVFGGLRSLSTSRSRKDIAPFLRDLTAQPVQFKRLEEKRAFLASFATAQSISVIGYLLSGAFLSVLFYPQLFFLTALAQASLQGWRREITVLHARPKAGTPAPARG